MKVSFLAKFFKRPRSLLLAMSLASAVGCSGSDESPSANPVGGASGVAAASGGDQSVGGSVATAGATFALGGSAASSGGSAATGGSVSSSGGSAAGSGGSAATGGSVLSSGGLAAGSGGSAATGGSVSSSGGSAAGSGGSSTTGGSVSSSGGSAPATGGSAGDTVPPIVTAVTPIPGAAAIALGSAFQLTFSEALSPTSVTGAAFPLALGTYAIPTNVVLSAPDTVTVTPLNPLPGGVSVTLQAATTIRDLAGNGMTLPATYLYTTAADNVPPIVVATSPAGGTTGVSRMGNIQITFSEPLDSATVIPANFGVLQGTTVVVPVVAYQANTATVVLTTPTVEPLTTVTVTVGTGVRDASGLALAQSYSWFYTTEADSSLPTIISTSPASGATEIAVDATVSLVFSESMDSTSFAGNVSVNGVAATVTYDATTHSVNVQHTPFSAGAPQTILVAGSVRDAYGNAAGTPYTFTFTTAPDTTAPSVVSSVPALGARFVGTDLSPMKVTFSEDMNPATLLPANAHIVGLTGTATYDVATRTVTIVPSSTLAAGTGYTLEIVGARDMGSNSLPTYQVPFRTPRLPVKLNTTGANGIVGLPSVAFNSSGVGVATWTIQTGGGFAASYAVYSGGVWGTEHLLAACPNQAGTGYATVGTDGTTFLVGNSACDSTYTLRTVSAAGAVGTPFAGPSIGAPYAVQIIGSPAGFLITAESTFAVIVNGALSGGSQYCGAGARGAASGNTFMVVCGGGMIQTGLVGYRWAAGTWSASTTLFSTTQTSGISARLAGGPLGYVLAWTFTNSSTVPSTSNAYQRTFTGTGPWSAQTLIESLGSQKELVLAMASDHAVVAYNDGTTSPSVRWTSWNGTTWTAPASLSATSSSPSNAAASGTAVAISWGGIVTSVQASVNAAWGTAASFDFSSNFTGNGAGGFAAPTTNGGFPAVRIYSPSTVTWSAPSNVENVAGSSPLLRLSGSNLMAVTYSSTGIRATAAPWGGSWGTPATLSFTPHRVGGLVPKIMRSGNRIVAVWVEYGGTQLVSCQLDASVFDGTSWSTPMILGSSSCSSYAGIGLSRTTGDGVIVSWIDGTNCRVTRYASAGGWMATVGTVGAATACAVDMDGSTWVAARQSGASTLTATSADGLTWGTATTFANLSGPKVVVSGTNRVIFVGASTGVTAEHFVGSAYTARTAVSATGTGWDAAGDGLGGFGAIKAGTVALYDPVTTLWSSPSTTPALASGSTSLLSALPGGGGWLAATLGTSTGSYALRSSAGAWSSVRPMMLGTQQVVVSPGSTPFMLVQNASSILGSDLSATGQLGPYGTIDSPGPFVGVNASTDASGNIATVWSRFNGDAAYDIYAAANL